MAEENAVVPVVKTPSDMQVERLEAWLLRAETRLERIFSRIGQIEAAANAVTNLDEANAKLKKCQDAFAEINDLSDSVDCDPVEE